MGVLKTAGFGAGRRILVALGALALAIGAAGRASATALELYGFGSRAAAMGSTGVASVDGVHANYYNPAALASLSGISIVAGYQLAPTTLTLNGRDVGPRNARASSIGMGFGLSTFGRRAGLAMALQVPDAGLYGVRLRPTGSPQFALVDARRDRIHVMGGYGIAAAEKVDLGISVSLLSHTRALTEIEYGDEQGAALDARLEPTRTVYAGVRAGPFAGVTTGLAFRQENVTELSVPTTLRATIGTIDADISVDATDRLFYTPQQWVLGASWERNGLVAAADLQWSRWSTFSDPNGFKRIEVIDRAGNLPPGSHGHEEEDPRFHDTWSPRLGLEWRPSGERAIRPALRAGYAFEPTPAPKPTPTRNLIDADRHTVGFGLGVAFRDPPVLTGPLSLDAHVTYGALRRRVVTRDDPTDPVGAYVADGTLWSVGVVARFEFAASYLRSTVPSGRP